jgi:Transposase, Mutator family
MALQELLRKAELDKDVDFLREGVRAMAQQLMELEVAQHVGADKYERAASWTGERNAIGIVRGILGSAVSSCALRVPATAAISGAARAAPPWGTSFAHLGHAPGFHPRHCYVHRPGGARRVPARRLPHRTEGQRR